MPPFEADIVTRGKLVQIRGEISKQQNHWTDFLLAYKEGYRGFLKDIADRLGYTGTELWTSVAFCLLIAGTQLYNLFIYSSSISYQLTILLSSLYILTFSCLLNFKSQIFGQLAALFLCVVYFLLVLYIGFAEAYVAGGALASVALCLLSKGTVYLLDSYYAESVTVTFSFQSNLILFNYLCWKGYQILLNQINAYSLDSGSLILVLITLSAINLLKIYNLFDYDIIQVIRNFQEDEDRKEEEKKKDSMQMSKSISVFIKQNPSEQWQSSVADRVKQPVDEEREPTAKVSNESAVKLSNDEDLSGQRINEIDTVYFSYQSRGRIIVTVITSLVLSGFIAVVLIKYISASPSAFQSYVLYYLVAAVRMTVLLLLCDFLKTIHGQIKDAFYYCLLYSCDCFWIAASAFFMQMPTLCSLSTEESIVLSISPLLAIKLFKHWDRAVHSELDNGKYGSFLFGYVLPILVRQIAIVEEVTWLTYALDGVVLGYTVFVLIVLGCKDDILYFWKDIRTLLSSKKNRLKIFEKLKMSKFDYEAILQNYIYLHAIYLNFFYYFFSELSSLLTVTYYILYLAPIVLYLSALINSYNYSRSGIPEQYSPSIFNIGVLILSIAYAAFASSGVVADDHMSWSLAVLLNVGLFMLTLQGEKLAVVQLRNYSSFIRALILATLFVLVYFPFIVAFCSGYFLTNFSQDYLLYYGIGGFLYIWLLITIIGVSTHWILNLTEKSKKQLFIGQYMENQMKKMNIKQNMEKILMISNMYEEFNYVSEELLHYLKAEKHMLVAIRKEKEYEYDYELVEPEEKEKRRLSIIAKPMSPLELAKIIDGRFAKKETEEGQVVEEDNSNPVLNFFKEKQRNKIEIAPKNENSNLIELKRMAAKMGSIPNNQKSIEATSEYKEMQKANHQLIADTIARLYFFLSEPSKTINRETFTYFIKLITKEDSPAADIAMTYDRFSQHSLMDEYKFKKFLLDYINFKYELRQHDLQTSLRTFCCRQMVPLFLSNFQPIKYYLKRKKISISDESLQIWLSDRDNEPESSEFNLLKQREMRKKARLLKRTIEHRKSAKMHQEIEKEGEVEQQQITRTKAKQESLKKTEKKQLKDKTFLKPENIYSMLVSAMIDCYLLYEKDAQSFKIKSIKFNLSNVLELLIKFNDIAFVFGYSTIYVFIAYYQEDYTSGTPLLSYVSYEVLIIAASVLVLAYIAIIMYHKKDFETGTLGLDEEHRSLDFKSFKFWSKTVMFMMGSGLANYIIAIGLNSWICDQSRDSLFNFSDVSCYNKVHYGYMLGSLLILVVYWPLSVITYPFNTAMDRNLEIKYKVEYQVIYLQVKFMINGFNTLLNPFPYQTQQLIGSILKVVLCCVLAILYNRLQPCSYQLLNIIEAKVYIILAVLSFAGALCYFIGLLYSVIATGSLLLIYIVYFIYVTIKGYSQLKNQNGDDEIIEDIVKNQKIKIEIIRQNNEENEAREDMSATNLKKTTNILDRSRLISKNNQHISEPRVASQTIYYNDSLKVVSSSSNTRGSHIL